MTDPVVAAVLIGRNEGDRLRRCLETVAPQVARMIYVDSGSTDGSVAAARAAGAEVVELPADQPFTAARARNAGFARAGEAAFVQFIDGDCALQDGWVAAALAAMAQDVAVVCGRRREARPDASVYNRLCDLEWDTPVGEALACGGDALIRAAALREAGGYRDSLIAGEEPELCLRLRRAGWRVQRIDAEMTLHDAAMTRFGQWWRRARRAGHAYAEGAWLHGGGPERHYVRQTFRALGWSAIAPLALTAALASPWALLLLLVYPAQVARLSRRPEGPAAAVFSVLGKFAEAQGVIDFHIRRLIGRPRGLIEYK